MDAQTLSLDHFLFYETNQEVINERVKLQCQFDKEPEAAGVQQRVRFGDRIDKNNEGLYDDTHSLTWYNLYDPVVDPDRVVIYDDQFGKEHKIAIGRLVAMLAPTKCGVSARKFPENLDHYKVFEVIGPEPPVNIQINLVGEFQSIQTTVSSQLYFAAPCTKSHQGREFKIQNEEAHLVFYGINVNVQEPTFVKTKDQFGRFQVALHTPHMLAVPCLKQKWEEL